VKKKPNGKISNYIFDNLKLGSKVILLNIGGEFSCFVKDIPEKLLFIAGGVGITPLMSMLRGLIKQKSNTDVIFYIYNSTPADFIFTKEIEAIKKLTCAKSKGY